MCVCLHGFICTMYVRVPADVRTWYRVPQELEFLLSVSVLVWMPGIKPRSSPRAGSAVRA